MICVLCGGVGAARFLAGLVQVVPGDQITAVVNVGDDTELYGLHVSPDLDTVTYTLAGEIDTDRGWGLRGETWQALETLRRLGDDAWFNLGDRDLGTHLYRTRRLGEGAPLSVVTQELATGWGVDVHVVPVTDDPLRTRVTVTDPGGSVEVAFQEYFVRRQHSVAVEAVRFEGAETCRPAPGVLEAIDAAGAVVIAPSNPLVSIAPVLAVPGVRDAVIARRAHTVAVSPIVAGAALKGPADRMLAELGHEPSVRGVAELYSPLATALVIDEADRAVAEGVRTAGMDAVVTPTVMSSPERAAALARTVLDTVGVAP